MSTRRRATGWIPRALDAVRARRASQQATIGETAGPGQIIDRSGRIVPNLGDVQYIDRNGKQQIRIDEASLHVVAGSPKRIAARTKPSDVQAVAVEAAAATAELDLRTQDFLLDHETRIVTLEGASGSGGGAPEALYYAGF